VKVGLVRGVVIAHFGDCLFRGWLWFVASIILFNRFSGRCGWWWFGLVPLKAVQYDGGRVPVSPTQ
jgi:hypothetical protein